MAVVGAMIATTTGATSTWGGRRTRWRGKRRGRWVRRRLAESRMLRLTWRILGLFRCEGRGCGLCLRVWEVASVGIVGLEWHASRMGVACRSDVDY